MTNEDSGKPQQPQQTLTDEQITTERPLRRRSFLTAVGALVAGGAAVMVSGGRAVAADPDQTDDPDRKKRPDDPDKPKRPDDPDKPRPDDPDRKPPLPPPGDPHPGDRHR